MFVSEGGDRKEEVSLGTMGREEPHRLCDFLFNWPTPKKRTVYSL